LRALGAIMMQLSSEESAETLSSSHLLTTGFLTYWLALAAIAAAYGLDLSGSSFMYTVLYL